MRAGKTATFVVHLKIEEWKRPSVGSQIKLPVSSKIWTIVRVEPPNNPPGQSNTYFIEDPKDTPISIVDEEPLL